MPGRSLGQTWIVLCPRRPRLTPQTTISARVLTTMAFDLCLLGCGHSELVESLLEIVEKGLPFGSCDPEMLVRVLHRTTRVLLWSTSSPADHFRDEVLEAWWGNSMMSLVYPRARI